MIYEETEQPMTKGKAKKSKDERASNKRKVSTTANHQKGKRHRAIAEKDEEDDILEDFTP